MKKKWVFLLSMVLGQCFVWGYGELAILNGVFAWWHCASEAWKFAFDNTHDFIEKTTKNIVDGENYNCMGDDLKAIWVFVYSISCVERFSQTQEFKENAEQYDSWFRNLYRIAYNVASQKTVGSTISWGCKYIDLLDDKNLSIDSLCKKQVFKNWTTEVAGVLFDSINWGED